MPEQLDRPPKRVFPPAPPCDPRQALEEHCDSRRREHAPDAAGDRVPGVARVAAEELVAALAGERHLDLRRDGPRDVPERDRRRIGERLLEAFDDRGEVGCSIRADGDLVVVAADRLGHRSRRVELVEGGIAEADGERHRRLAELVAGEEREERRVDPTREQDRERHIRAEVEPHRLAERLLERQTVVGGLERPPALTRQRAVLPDERGSGLQPLDRGEGCVLARHVTERQVIGDRLPVDRAVGAEREKRRDLGGEREASRRLRCVERLDPEPVACEHKPPPPRVPEGDREHAAQLGEARGAVLLVQVRHRLHVAAPPERVPAPRERGPQLLVVVELAVDDRDDVAGLVRDRLITGDEVDDRQPAHPHRDRPVSIAPLTVGAAVGQQIERVERVARCGAVRGDEAENAAHASATLPRRR